MTITNAKPVDSGSGDNPTLAAYHARAVLYKTESEVSNTFYFRLLNENGKPVTDQASADVAITSENGLVNVTPDMLSIDPQTGLASLTLTPECLQVLVEILAAAGGEPSRAVNLYDYLTITVNGVAYVMQVVINQNGRCDTAAENEAHPPGGVIGGEWHTEIGDNGTGGLIIGSRGDQVWFRDATPGFTNGSQGAGTGADRVLISGGEYGVLSTDRTIVKASKGRTDIEAGGRDHIDTYCVATFSNGAVAEISGDGVNVSVDNDRPGDWWAYGIYASGRGAETRVVRVEPGVDDAVADRSAQDR